MHEMNSPGTGLTRTIEQRNSMGWATVNQPTPLQGSHTYERAASTAGSYLNLEQTRREGTVINEEGTTALIDALPKSKQRQVYGYVFALRTKSGLINFFTASFRDCRVALSIYNENWIL